MEEELVGKFNHTFKTYHRFMLIVYVITNMAIFLTNIDKKSELIKGYNIISVMIGLLAIVLLMVVYDTKLVRNDAFTSFTTCSYIFIMTGLMLVVDSRFYKVIFGLFIIEIVFENSIKSDYEDADKRIIQLIALTCGFIIELVVFSVILEFTSVDVIASIVTCILIVGMSTLIMLAHNTIISYYDEKVFSKARLLEDVNNTNNQLVDNQEKINRANEMLGMQKIKLEAAYNKINRINSEMVILNKIIIAINESKDINELTHLITSSVCKGINMNLCSVVIESDVVGNKERIITTNTVYSQGFTDDFMEFQLNGRFPDEFDENEIIVDNKVDTSKYVGFNTSLIGSLLMIPLKLEDKIIGRLYVGNSKYGYFKDDLSFYNSIVVQFIIGIKNIQLFITLENMAIRDGLTGIYNRRRLNVIEREWINKLDVNRQSLTSVLLDIDKFKNINDSYGHKAGDIIIRGVADTISNLIEGMENAIAARYGGEEFVILFFDVDFDKICSMIENLHKSIKSKYYVQGENNIYVDVSIGIASYPVTCDSPEVVINRSDWAMYYSKQNGRGRITIDNPEVDKLRK